MDEEKVAAFPSIADDVFLASCDFGRELLAGKTSEFPTFRIRCREFMDQLVSIILKCPSASSRVSRGIYSFCPELLLEGDGQLVFQLFPDLCRVLESCGCLSSDDSKAAVEEFSSYVVEKPNQHERSMGVAKEIPNMVNWLLRDFSFLARHRVCRVLKLCVLVTGRPRAVYPVVTFDLSGSKLSVAKFQECLRLVQSYVLSPGYEHQSFFTEPTMKAVQDAINNAGVFYVAPNFDLWADFCGGSVSDFISHYWRLYGAFLLSQRKSCEIQYMEKNKANRLARAQQVSTNAISVGAEASGSGKNKAGGQRTTSGSTTSSNKEATSGLVVSKNKKKPSKDDDPDVRHRIKKF